MNATTTPRPITDHDLALARRTFSGTAWPVPQLIAEVDRLRAIEQAVRTWYEADRAYVEADFGNDEDEQAVAHVAKDALRAALGVEP